MAKKGCRGMEDVFEVLNTGCGGTVDTVMSTSWLILLFFEGGPEALSVLSLS